MKTIIKFLSSILLLVSASACSKFEYGYYHDVIDGNVPMKIKNNLVFVTFTTTDTPVSIEDFNKSINYDSAVKIVNHHNRPLNPSELYGSAILKGQSGMISRSVLKRIRDCEFVRSAEYVYEANGYTFYTDNKIAVGTRRIKNTEKVYEIARQFDCEVMHNDWDDSFYILQKKKDSPYSTIQLANKISELNVFDFAEANNYSIIDR